jgi:magnesium transporter
MIYGFTQSDGRLEAVVLHRRSDCSDQLIWLDLIDPSEQERGWIKDAYGYDLATYEEMGEIAASARFFRDAHGIHLNAYSLVRAGNGNGSGSEYSAVRNLSVAFDLIGDRLFTLHRDDLPEFRALRSGAEVPSVPINNARDVLLELMQGRLTRAARLLQAMHTQLEAISRSIFDHKRPDMEQVLADLAHLEDSNSKGRLALLDNQRSLKQLARSAVLDTQQAERLADIITDIDSLVTHVSFFFDKIDFLMDSAMGVINIEQNKVIKLFSIAAVFFLPPTLVATIYGMNFDRMPELHWQYGYVFALGLMVASAAATIWFFRRRGWL